MSRGRVLGLLGGAALLLLVLAGAWLAVTALQARSSLETARGELTRARDALLQRDLVAARDAVTRAGRDTERARGLTGDPVWRVATAVPGAPGNNLRVVRGLSRAADDVARRVLPQALSAADGVDPARLRLPDGRFDLDVVARARPAVRAAADEATRVQQDVDALPTVRVVGPVASARTELGAQVDQLAGALRGVATGAEIAPALLGLDRPRRFFVLVQQNGESRGTGGLPGGYAILETDKGRIRVAAAGSRNDLKDGPIDVPPGVPLEFVSRYRSLGSFDILVNTNVSPDLPMVSRLFAERLRENRNEQIDGVVALDAQALAAVLRGNGPIAVNGRSIAADQLVEYLAVGQYADFDAPLGQRLNVQAAQRKDALAEAGRATLAQLVAGGGDTRALLTGLGAALSSGHLRMASDDPALGPALHRAGVDGALPATDRPVAYPVVFNSTGGKLDSFLDRSVEYTARGCTGPVRRATVTVRLTNQAPATGLPAYLRIRDDGNGARLSADNAVTLSVYTTPGSTLRRATLDGVVLDPRDPNLPMLSRFMEGGLPAYALFVDLPAGRTRTLVLELDEPTLAGAPQLPEQPLARPLQRRVDAPTC